MNESSTGEYSDLRLGLGLNFVLGDLTLGFQTEEVFLMLVLFSSLGEPESEPEPESGRFFEMRCVVECGEDTGGGDFFVWGFLLGVGGKTGLGLCVEEGVGGFQSPREVGIE